MENIYHTIRGRTKSPRTLESNSKGPPIGCKTLSSGFSIGKIKKRQQIQVIPYSSPQTNIYIFLDHIYPILYNYPVLSNHEQLWTINIPQLTMEITGPPPECESKPKDALPLHSEEHRESPPEPQHGSFWRGFGEWKNRQNMDFTSKNCEILLPYVTCCKYTPICWVYYTYIHRTS